MLLHLSLLVRALRAQQVPRWLRLLAVLPPVTPIAAWQGGARVLTLLWAGAGLIYCALRALAGGF
jgi:uncharacterized membrane protein YhaH (DUF805 family)